MDKHSAITNFVAISDVLGTGGMPTAAQLQDIAAAGYATVINLAWDEPPSALPGEADLARSLGMEYTHIPVAWENPRLEDIASFFAVMDGQKDRKVFVHCVMNYRVSAFVYLYRSLRLGVAEADAWRDLTQVWTPNGVWADLIANFVKQWPGE